MTLKDNLRNFIYDVVGQPKPSMLAVIKKIDGNNLTAYKKDNYNLHFNIRVTKHDFKLNESVLLMFPDWDLENPVPVKLDYVLYGDDMNGIAPTPPTPPSPPVKNIRVGIYHNLYTSDEDKIRDTINVYISTKPNIEPCEISLLSKLNNDSLKDIDIVILPGGDSGRAYIQDTVNINIGEFREWFINGGGIISICAGSYACLNKVDGYYDGWGLANNYNSNGSNERTGYIELKYTKDGEKFFNNPLINEGNLTQDRIFRGPIMYPLDESLKNSNILATYNVEKATPTSDCEEDSNNSNTPEAEGLASIIYQKNQEGIIVCFGPHPETKWHYNNTISLNHPDQLGGAVYSIYNKLQVNNNDS